MKSLRDEIAALVAARTGDGGADPPLAVDVLTHTGVRADHQVPTGPSPPSMPQGEAGGPVGTRYTRGGRLGEGGMGFVDVARDRNLGRDVALKSIPAGKMDPRRLSRFVAEARITAQLEHPGIVPVHDLFITESGDVHYSMKRVSGMSLREVLEGLQSDDPATVTRYNLVHLLNVFLAACRAVAYAHVRRVIHRDLKPANIMVGDFGEVMVMDWGVARVLDEATPLPDLSDEMVEESASLVQTADGVMVGSPAYMAPEQMELGPRGIGPGADVYALGIILYEILTLTRPYQADSIARLLYLSAKGDHPSPSMRAPGRDIPPEVEAICLRALATRPEDRYADGGELTRALEAYLEGVGPRREADRLVAQGRELLYVFQNKAQKVEEERVRAKTLAGELNPWDPIEMKRLAWDAERTLADALAEEDAAFGNCEAAFESATSHVASYRPALDGLADLYWICFLKAERARDSRWIRRWRELILRFAPDRFASRLEGEGTLTIEVRPGGANAVLLPLGEVDGRLVPTEERALGLLPAKRLPVAMGSYVLELSGRGLASCRLPLVVERSLNVRLSPWMAAKSAVHPGFVHVPGGSVHVGGDPAAISGRPERYMEVPDFAIARYPVSAAQYVRFLKELAATNPEEAFERLPRTRGGVGVRREPVFGLDAGGDLTLPFRDRDGHEWRAEQPIVSITIEDARAYAAWAGERSGFPLRLPTESEWEKAARGTDRRIFPWGDRFDAGFCIMAESSPTPPSRCVIGEEPRDVSPYGVRDLGGGVRDWVEWDPGTEVEGRSVLRGGSYGTVAIYCHCASRSVVGSYYVGSHVGFRLAHDLTPTE